MSDLPIIQKTYDLIKWYVPILNRVPREHKFLLANRMITGLYDIRDALIVARYSTKDKLAQLESLKKNSGVRIQESEQERKGFDSNLPLIADR
ncbi:hypothetical protein [Aetokthonos hydrillicola]|jgi:hypothetical protein|uniref:hypothetical protein n=1 Tax=Aetokthonos hydrillicola TaxID=1550245 RepID=UPI00287756AB|nr:hypothetical protein [Aetokthonos hydrillicola]